MAYGQNDHGYAYPTRGATILDLIKNNPAISGYVSDECGNDIFISNGGVSRQTCENIARGPDNLSENQIYWVKSNANLLYGKYGSPYKKGGANPHVPAIVSDIFHEMFGHIFGES